MVAARREKRRKQIYEGAVKVFAEKGYHDATTQEIADAAGLAKGTVYEYMESKEDILMLVIEVTIGLLRNELEKTINELEDPAERFERAISVQLDFARKHQSAAVVMMNELKNLSEPKLELAGQITNDMVETFRSIIDYGIKEGCFKKIDSRIAAELFMHTCTMYFDYGEKPHQKCSLDDITKFILEHFVHAILIQE